MGRRRRRQQKNFIDEGVAGIVVIAIIIYAFITAIFWLLIIGYLVLVFFLVYQLCNYFENLWIRILISILGALVILVGGSEVLHNYGKINQSIIDYSVDTAGELRLKTSKKGNVKVESNFGTLIETKN